MAEDVTTWIGKSLIAHAREHGSDLTVPRRGKYCQLTQFDTYRDGKINPHGQVSGVICDKTHWVKVFFDVAATDTFEASKHQSLTPDRLTSHLRAIFMIEEYKIHLINPSVNQEKRNRSLSRLSSTGSNANGSGVLSDLPRVELEVLKWRVAGGDRHDPVFFERTVEVGRGKGDAAIQKVLRNWYTGESDDEAVPVIPSEAVAGPSRLTAEQPRPPTTMNNASTRKAARDQLFAPFIANPTADRNKPLPDWIFDISQDQLEELQDIQIFGLDPDANLDQTSESHVGHSEEVDMLNTEGLAPRRNADPTAIDSRVSSPVPSSRHSELLNDEEEPVTVHIAPRPPSQIPSSPILPMSQPSYPSLSFPRPAQSVPPTAKTLSSQSKVILTQKIVESMEVEHDNSMLGEEEEEDDLDLESSQEMTFKPLQGKRKSDKAFESILAGFNRSPSASQEEENKREETDEEELSDYERNQRKKLKLNKQTPTLGQIPPPLPSVTRRQPIPSSPVPPLSIDPPENAQPILSSNSTNPSDPSQSSNSLKPSDASNSNSTNPSNSSTLSNQSKNSNITSNSDPSDNSSKTQEGQDPAQGLGPRSSPWPNNISKSGRLRTPSESLSGTFSNGLGNLSRGLKDSGEEMTGDSRGEVHVDEARGGGVMNDTRTEDEDAEGEDDEATDLEDHEDEDERNDHQAAEDEIEADRDRGEIESLNEITDENQLGEENKEEDTIEGSLGSLKEEEHIKQQDDDFEAEEAEEVEEVEEEISGEIIFSQESINNSQLSAPPRGLVDKDDQQESVKTGAPGLTSEGRTPRGERVDHVAGSFSNVKRSPETPATAVHHSERVKREILSEIKQERRSPHEPLISRPRAKRSKLNGFKPDLSVKNGLTQKWVQARVIDVNKVKRETGIA